MDSPHQPVGQAVPVIEVLRNGSLRLNERALDRILNNPQVRDLPVVVVAVAGALRTGKSFALNFLLRFLNLGHEEDDWLGPEDARLDSFPWRSGPHAHTQGIVFWSHLLKARTAEGEEVAILLVDTQGSFGPKTRLADSIRIFSLTILLSSMQVFNVMKCIQLDHLHHLQMFVEYGRLVQQSTGGESPFQSLVFLVRDWPHPSHYPFGWEGGDEYLYNVLGTPEDTEIIEEDGLQASITSCYTERRCFLLPSPGKNVESASFTGTIGETGREFREEQNDFVRGLLSPERLVIKEVAGQRTTGRNLVDYISTLVRAFSSNELIEPSTLTDEIARYQWQSVFDLAFKKYFNNMNELGRQEDNFLSQEELRAKHSNVFNAILAWFDEQRCMRREVYYERKRAALTEGMEELFGTFAETYQAERERVTREKKNEAVLAGVAIGCFAFALLSAAAAISVCTLGLADIMAAGIGGGVFTGIGLSASVGTGVHSIIKKEKRKSRCANGILLVEPPTEPSGYGAMDETNFTYDETTPLV